MITNSDPNPDAPRLKDVPTVDQVQENFNRQQPSYRLVRQFRKKMAVTPPVAMPQRKEQ
jgi:hypothetical protein